MPNRNTMICCLAAASLSLFSSLAVAQQATTPAAVGGEPEFELEVRQAKLDDGTMGDMFIAGPMRIVSPLPEGYPRPTTAGAMEIKTYPSVRRAEITVEASPRWGMNMAFFPLFRHIQDREIAMTAPVEADLPMMAREAAAQLDEGGQDESRSGEMTVSFLYRSSELGPTGDAEENVRVIDTKPITVLALGIRGTMNNNRIEREIEKLYEWVASQSDSNTGPEGSESAGRWQAEGDPRILGYNGPDVP